VVTVSRAVERRARSETRTFGAVTEEVRALVAWLDEQEVPIVAMESTGVYWKPVYRAIRTLSPTRTVWLVNPAHIKAVPRERPLAPFDGHTALGFPALKTSFRLARRRWARAVRRSRVP
jgi:transposase